MAKSTLDFSHPYFQKSIEGFQDNPDFEQGLAEAKRQIEANHEACHRVVQPMGPKYPDCHNKIWKYDWQPAHARGSTRKSWRMVVIVPDPTTQPYMIVAAAVYAKSATSQLSNKQLASIYAAITAPQQEQPEVEAAVQFLRVSNGDGRTRSLCPTCGESVAVSEAEDDLLGGESQHQCAGSLL